MSLLSFNGVYGIGHLIYLLVFVLLMVLNIFISLRFRNNDFKMNILVKVYGFILLVLIAINRISITYNDVVVEHKDGYTWLNIIPNTLCGLSSLLYSLTLLFGKKNNKVLHFIVYIGFIGGMISVIYPNFLDTQNFFDIRSITGLFHHALMVQISITLILMNYITPSISKFRYTIIGSGAYIVFGVFELEALHFKSAMQIQEPLLESAKVFTSWYMIFFMAFILLFIFLFTYEKIANKKKSIQIIKEMIE